MAVASAGVGSLLPCSAYLLAASCASCAQSMVPGSLASAAGISVMASEGVIGGSGCGVIWRSGVTSEGGGMGSCRRTLFGSVKNSTDAIAVGVAMRVLGARKSAVSTAMCNVTTAAQETYLD